MILVPLKNNRQVRIRLLQKEDEIKLLSYFNQLSEETKRRFGPHPFDQATVHRICTHLTNDDTQRFIAETVEADQLIAYMLLKNGVFVQDAARLLSYGIPTSGNDCTFAPSVAEACQSAGLGTVMFDYILKQVPGRSIILWGGVQASNKKAVHYYHKLGFYKVGMFEDHNGINFDMIRNPVQDNFH